MSETTTVGKLRKMRVEEGDPIQYTLPLGDESVAVNPLLGNTIVVRHTGDIHCVSCGRKTAKSFNQGHCFPCFRRLASCDACIVRPERCHYHLGTCREPEWGQAHCLRPHVVYLANSSGVKVGITRATQVPTRWIDQGAAQALPIARVASRRLSGLMEVAFKEHVSDRTDWRRMLKGEPEAVDLKASRDALFAQCDETLSDLTDEYDQVDPEMIADAESRVFRYPVLEYPAKVTAINLDKNPRAEGTLLGIKGQYLILDTGVLNVRKYGGYEIALSA
ncbi:MAG: DUF2797 domain-containing protein [Gammaproteobacteria bacterium]|jgi:hypothetical protein|nr:DUF2797 domain-containing protein [Gammaproteobacteria bacterium]